MPYKVLMKKIFIQASMVSTFAAMLMGCTSTGPSAYGPVTDNSRYGFQVQKIESDRFRVNFTAKTDMEAHDYALLRAAQIAQQEGYSHFKILSGDQYNNDRSSPVSTSVGVSTGRNYGRSRTNVGLEMDIYDVARALEKDKSIQMLEVRLLNAPGDKTNNVFSASEVIKNIRPAVFK